MSRSNFSLIAVFVAVLFVTLVTSQTAHASILTSQMGYGATGSNVTSLQQFLATNPLIYPAGLVTGYYGSLTQAAVVQFQAAYGISQVGRVGPTTQAKINSIMLSGLGLDTTAPVIANAWVQSNRNSAVVNWTTNELAQGQVYYDTSPIRSDEETGHGQLPYVGGISVPNSTGVSNSQSVTISNLQSNTIYYYFVRAIDSSGNISSLLSNTFRTNN